MNLQTEGPLINKISKTQSVLGWVLILLSSILLGVWALKGTIALRNSLLGVESAISIAYCIIFLKTAGQKIPFKNWLPLILIGLMFCWVIFHYFFLTRYPEAQYAELTSTWLRSWLAAIVGVGTALAVSLVSRGNSNAINYLWCGCLISLIYLFFQYLPKALLNHSFFTIDYVGYIFNGKISGVLIGTVLLAGIIGTALDMLRVSPISIKAPLIFFWACGCVLPLYVFVFILDTRNGIALAGFLVLIAIIIFFRWLNSCRNIQMHDFNKQIKSNKSYLVISIFLVMFLIFIWSHVRLNLGWLSTLEDAKIGLQVDQFINWQNPQIYGYPQVLSGRSVVPNTYERFAWATAGLTIFMPENPLGIGILKEPFRLLLLAMYPNAGSYIPSSHSAWIEIGLAYGYPSLLFLIGGLVNILYLGISSANARFKSLVILLANLLLALYTVGEVNSQHGMEVLIFWMAFLSAILFPIHEN